MSIRLVPTLPHTRVDGVHGPDTHVPARYSPEGVDLIPSLLCLSLEADIVETQYTLGLEVRLYRICFLL